MHMACQSGDMPLVQRLLELGETLADPAALAEGWTKDGCSRPYVCVCSNCCLLKGTNN